MLISLLIAGTNLSAMGFVSSNGGFIGTERCVRERLACPKMRSLCVSDCQSL